MGIDIIRELFNDMKKVSSRKFITKNTAIEGGKYRVSKIYIFWVLPIYKSVTILAG